MKKLLVVLILMSILLTTMPTTSAQTNLAEPTPESMLSKGISPISGTFIQPWLYNNYTDEIWEKEMTDWQELGIEYLIMGDVIWFDYQNNYAVTAAYPSNMENIVSKRDDVTKIFQKCKEFNIKLYIGVGNTSDWNFFDFSKPSNANVFKEVCTRFAAAAQELYDIYYEDYKEIFAGFYFVPELYNSSAFDSTTQRANYVKCMADGFNIVLDKINSFEQHFPLIFSPYVNIFGGSWVSKSYDNIEAFWTEFIKAANFREGDILCPQDSVGAGGMDLEKLDAMTRAYKNAVTNSEKGVKLWSNCEIFEQPKEPFFSRNDEYTYWNSTTIYRMTEQIKIVSQYVERVFVFAYPHYLSRYNAAGGFYNTYIDYLKTGELEQNAPTPPDKFRTYIQKKDGKDVLYISWSGMYDDYGVYRVNIYKNDELVTYRIPYRSLDGQSLMLIYPNSFYDLDYDFTTTESVTYEFEVIDCAGNISERSSFTVEPDSVPNGVRLDAAYKGPVVVSEESSEEPSEASDESFDESSTHESSEEGGGLGSKLGIIGVAILGLAAIAGGVYGLIRTRKSRGSKQ